jgi:dTDP-4-amino-4,6-dideoxygalactose transaminase
MIIPFGDQSREIAEISGPLDEATHRVIESGRFILGPEVEAFEREFAQWVGVPFAIGVASGTEAIALALMALGIGHEDEVITAANTCVPTAVGIAMSGATIRLADCESDTLMISPESVEAAITGKTRAIVPVHLYGNAADMPALRSIADRHSLVIVEDCAQSVGTLIGGTATGSFGDAAAFSFYPTKNLGAYGDGGCVLTKDRQTAEILKSLRNYGYERRDFSVRLGINSRLDEFQAAILRVKVPRVANWNAQRTSIAEMYLDACHRTGIRIPFTRDRVKNGYHLFPILADNRDTVQKLLQERGVQALIHYPVPLHLQPALARLGYHPGDFPNAETACSQELSIPIFPQLSKEEVETIIQALERVHQETSEEIWQTTS